MNKTIISYKGLEFQPFTEQDVNILTPVMKKAFDTDMQIHTDKVEGGPDGYDNGDFLRKWYLHKDSVSFKILKYSKPIGGVCVWINKNNVNYLGNVFIDSEFQDKGLGKIVWEFIEHNYPDTVKWCTETPAFSRRNHNFYINKCGFKVIKIQHPKKASGGSFILEKTYN